jgi:subtilisin family serine protease
MAAPAVTGMVALYYAEALRKKKDLTGQQVRDLLIKAAKKQPPTNGWDPRYGNGRLSADGLPDV